jgi:hypothetical protein
MNNEKLNKDEIYQIWAPPHSVWSRWTKPVLFAFMDGRFDVPPARTTTFNVKWVPAPGSVAIIVDLPGEDGVLWGMQLARLGYRPIPLYNALPFPPREQMYAPSVRPESTVHVEPILAALYRETLALRQVSLPAEAPPAFLLDASRRLARVDPAPGRFDNRSVCFSTDFPSAAFLLAQSIGQAILVQEEQASVAGDLLQILLAWQKSGIHILRKNPAHDKPPAPFVVKRPSFLYYLWYRVSVALGLRRGELGGFGGIIPSGSG